MIIISEILDRVKKIFALRTDKDLSGFLGIPKNTLSTWKSRNSMDWKLLFEKCEQSDFNYLIKGSPPQESQPSGQNAWSYEKDFKREGQAAKQGNIEIIAHMDDILRQRQESERSELVRKIEKLEIEKALLMDVIREISSGTLLNKEEA